jgi:hypothetical protein
LFDCYFSILPDLVGQSAQLIQTSNQGWSSLEDESSLLEGQQLGFTTRDPWYLCLSVICCKNVSQFALMTITQQLIL